MGLDKRDDGPLTASGITIIDGCDNCSSEFRRTGKTLLEGFLLLIVEKRAESQVFDLSIWMHKA